MRSIQISFLLVVILRSDLVMKSMEGITLPGTSVPPWAKEMTDLEWSKVVDRTMRNEKLLPSRPDKEIKVDDANSSLS